jgi:uncharacterized OB-fold protein
LSRVHRAGLTASYIAELPADVRRAFTRLGIIGDWGRLASWDEALGKTYTEISEMKVEEIILTNWRISCSYSRDPGRAVSRFLEGLRNGRILVTRCTRCGRTLLPPRSFCEWCFIDVETWVELTGLGEVATYSLSYIGTDPRERLTHPKIVAVIWFEDTKIIIPASRHTVHAAGLLHIIADTKPEDVKIGMRVKPVWKPRNERVGSILDISHFTAV